MKEDKIQFILDIMKEKRYDLIQQRLEEYEMDIYKLSIFATFVLGFVTGMVFMAIVFQAVV